MGSQYPQLDFGSISHMKVGMTVEEKVDLLFWAVSTEKIFFVKNQISKQTLMLFDEPTQFENN